MSENKLVPMTEEAEEDTTKTYDAIQTTEYHEDTLVETNNHGSKLATVAIVALAGLLAFAGYSFFGNGGTRAGQTEDANTYISAQQNPELKAEKLDPTKVYTLSKATDTLNGGSITIEKAQFRRDQTRLWMRFENKGGNKINMMPGATATLIDNNGHSYKADPFASQNITGIAPGASETVMLVFEPIRADASMVTFHMDMVFDMKNAAWQIMIPIQLP